MNGSHPQIDDIVVESSEECHKLKYEWYPPFTRSQRLFLRGLFIIWNGTIALFALAGIAMFVMLFFINNPQAGNFIFVLLFMPVWYGMLYPFYRFGCLMSRVLRRDRPLLGWRLSITSNEWHSEYFEAWSEHEKTLDSAAITDIGIDHKNRLSTEHFGNNIRLTTPLAEDTSEWLQEKLSRFLSASGKTL